MTATVRPAAVTRDRRGKVPDVCVIALGGTVATGLDGQPSIGLHALLDAFGPHLPRVNLRAIDLARVPSPGLRLANAARVARLAIEQVAEGCHGVVVLQGTDTIEEFAFALDLLYQQAAPLIVTGAMVAPHQAGSDAASNLASALRVAAAPQMRGVGCVVVLNDEIHTARAVRKTDTSSRAAFASHPFGPLGHVTEGLVTLDRKPVTRVRLPGSVRRSQPVSLLSASMDDDLRVATCLDSLGYRGLVVAGLGGGHLPASAVENVSQALAAMPVVLASRAGGIGLRDTYGYPGSERDLLGRGLLYAGDLAPAKARVALSLLLGAGLSGEDLGRSFHEVAWPQGRRRKAVR
ncbi:asparaginase domain-containing protein [Micromonospora sp. NPDC048830]|uniref:asparaginase domain-containing protein n=1 Tax=Micromonospora sp. NPDC048830 TaxID=3364257 RepID=UPI00371E4AEE